MNEYGIIGPYDYVLAPVYLIIFYVFAKRKEAKKLNQGKEHFKYFTKGLMVKLFGGLGLAFIYVFYYGGGDTTNYYSDSVSLLKLFTKFPNEAFQIIMGYTPDHYRSLYDSSTGFPIYWHDSAAFLMVRLSTVFTILGGGTFLGATLVVARVSYYGIWKLFELYQHKFKEFTRSLAIAILFIPSVAFWGSGLLKDTVTLTAVGAYSYFFYFIIIERKYSIKNIFAILICIFLIISLKPYIFFALVPGSVLWGALEFSKKIHNKWARRLFAPIMAGLGALGGYLILAQMDEQLGIYSLDTVLERAVVVQQDQKQEYYGGHSFDIGDFEPNLPSMLSKTHLALAATFYRPYIWEAANPVMFLSALENTFILLATLFLFFKFKLFGFFKAIFSNPLLLFSFLFTIFFGFSVGLSTSNFGSLVRLKIPCIPFYMTTLLILYQVSKQKIKSL